MKAWPFAVIVVVAVLLSLAVCGAAPPPASLPASAPATQPLSKDSRPHIRAFYQRIVRDAYDEVGKRDPKWDAAARRMLDAAAEDMSLGPAPLGDEEDLMLSASAATRKLNCDDPLVLYVTADSLAHWNRKLQEICHYLFRAADGMPHSGYHPLLKARALVRAAQYRARAEEDLAASLEKGKQQMEAAIALLPAIAADRDVPRFAVYQLFDMIGYASIRLTNDRQTYGAKAFKILDANCPHDRSLVLTVMARFYTDYAWDGRGQGFADDVPQDAWEKFEQRLTPARVAAEEAWNLDNDNAFAAIAMQRLCLPGGGENVDQWYTRAITAAPDSYLARVYKLQALEPKWHGSIEEMLAFARACAEEGEADPSIRLILVKAHLDASRYTDDGGYASAPRPAYFKDDPQVWADVKRVYEPYLDCFPNSLYHRSRFAQIAAWAGHWDEAEKQFQAMGDKFSYTYFRTRTNYQKVRAEVAHHASTAGD